MRVAACGRALGHLTNSLASRIVDVVRGLRDAAVGGGLAGGRVQPVAVIPAQHRDARHRRGVALLVVAEPLRPSRRPGWAGAREPVAVPPGLEQARLVIAVVTGPAAIRVI